MNFRRRILVWLIIVLFIAAAAAYVAWEPYRPADLYRAIPARASLVSSHQDLAGRWPILASNALFQGLSAAAATGPEADRRALPAFNVRPWIERLARKETVIARIPAPGADGGPAWIFTSWIGSASHYLRWSLALRGLSGLERRPSYCNGRPIWTFRQPVTASGLRLSLACGEGLLIGCLARHPNAMRQALMAYDGLAPSLASAPAGHPPLPTGRVPDQGWWRRLPPARTTFGPSLIACSVSRLDAEHLAAEFHIQPEPELRAPLSAAPDLAACGQLLGDLPALIAILPLEVIRQSPAWAAASPEFTILRQALQSGALAERDNHLVLALLDGDYAGGIGKEPLRIRIPTLLFLIKVRDPAGIKALVGEVTDKLNARLQLGLITDPAPLPAGKLSAHALEATAPNFLASLAPEDRLAYATAGSWLILSSNARSLVKLLERYPSREAPPPAAPGRWQKKLAASQAAVFLWMDLEVCGRVLQLPLTMLALQQRGGSPAEDGDSAQIIKGVKTWLERARPLKSAALWLESGQPAPAFRLEIGE